MSELETKLTEQNLFLQDALCHALAAMEVAINTSVAMARGVKDTSVPHLHMQIQNVLGLSRREVIALLRITNGSRV